MLCFCKECTYFERVITPKELIGKDEDEEQLYGKCDMFKVAMIRMNPMFFLFKEDKQFFVEDTFGCSLGFPKEEK